MITNDTIERGPLSNASSPFVTEMKSEEKVAMEKEVDDIYQRFLVTVATGRKKTVDDIRAIAEGRVWSGQDAMARGLVDEMGGLVDAVRRAKAEASLDPNAPVELVTLPRTREA
ncbi:MAG: S49 family peptidase, partial [Proteobacteria bacterium]|nr:S49 family peptidase [Pseudomonadota bacterium]